MSFWPLQVAVEALGLDLGRHNTLGDAIDAVDYWCDDAVGGVVRLPLGLAIYTSDAFDRRVASVAVIAGVDRSRLGPRLIKHLPPDPTMPKLHVV